MSSRASKHLPVAFLSLNQIATWQKDLSARCCSSKIQSFHTTKAFWEMLKAFHQRDSVCFLSPNDVMQCISMQPQCTIKAPSLAA